MLLALHHHRSASSRFWNQVGVVASAILGAPVRYVRHRRLLSTMAQMSEHELKDIGLAWHDVNDATALRLDSDVGLFLAERARDRTRSSIRC